MSRYHHSKSGVFLLEIILNVLLFSVLTIVSLQFFIKAHQITNDTNHLHRAVTSCTNVASVFQSGDGSYDTLLQQYPYATYIDSLMIIYFNDNFEPCSKDNATFFITAVRTLDKDISGLAYMNLTCYNQNEVVLYELTASHYKSMTPRRMEVTR